MTTKRTRVLHTFEIHVGHELVFSATSADDDHPSLASMLGERYLRALERAIPGQIVKLITTKAPRE